MILMVCLYALSISLDIVGKKIIETINKSDNNIQFDGSSIPLY